MRLLERAWESAWRDLFRAQERATLSRLAGKRGRQMLRQAQEQRADDQPLAAEVFDPGFWQVRTIEVATDLYGQVFAAGGARVAEKFKIAFDLTQEGVTEQITKRAHDLSTQVNDTTYRTIRDALAAGITEGETVPQLSARIRAVFDQANSTRATRIARTEVISAYNGAQKAGVAALPSDVVGGQEWISTRDGRTRPEHAGADGQIVPVDQPFDVGGEALAYPGDPNGSAAMIVNCRCTIAFLTPGELGESIMPSGDGAPTATEDQGIDRGVAELLLTRVALGNLDADTALRQLEPA